METRTGPGSVWRLQAAPRDLIRALDHCSLSANCLVVPEAVWSGFVADTAYVECPTFFLEDKAAFVALLAYFVINTHPFRLFVRASEGEDTGLLLAYPRLDDVTMQMLRRFDSLAAAQVTLLCDRLDALLGRIGQGQITFQV